MGKLILKPNPTFFMDVKIHVPGDEPMVIKFEFNHKTRPALDEFLYAEGASQRKDIDTIMDIAKGWPGQDVPFTRENVAELLTNYHGSGTEILRTYVDELTKARLGN